MSPSTCRLQEGLKFIQISVQKHLDLHRGDDGEDIDDDDNNDRSDGDGQAGRGGGGGGGHEYDEDAQVGGMAVGAVKEGRAGDCRRFA